MASCFKPNIDITDVKANFSLTAMFSAPVIQRLGVLDRLEYLPVVHARAPLDWTLIILTQDELAREQIDRLETARHAFAIALERERRAGHEAECHLFVVPLNDLMHTQATSWQM